jgi:hypothetical protein
MSSVSHDQKQSVKKAGRGELSFLTQANDFSPFGFSTKDLAAKSLSGKFLFLFWLKFYP